MFINKYKTLITYFSFMLLKFISVTWIVLIGLVSVIDLSELYNRTRFKKNVNIEDIIIMTIQNIPARAEILLLYAILFGSVLCFLELRKTNEFIILRINGMSIWHSFLMVALVPLFLGISSILVLNPLMSLTQKLYLIHKEEILEPGKRSLKISIDGLWLRDKSNSGKTLIRGKYLDPSLGKIKKPIFFLNKDDIETRIDADWAILSNNMWILENPKINGDIITSPSPIIIESILTKDDLSKASSEPQSLNIFELPRFINVLENTGIPSSRYRVYFHKIISQPISFIGITALTSALIFGWFSRMHSIRMTVYSILGGFFYFFIQRLFTALGGSEQMPILLAGWMPSLILLGTGIFFLALIEEV